VESHAAAALEPGRRAPIALIGYCTFLLLGWTGLLVPSLIRSVEHDLAQTDAGMAAFYLLYSLLYAAGSLFGGFVIERVGRRLALTACGFLAAVGLIGMTAFGDWLPFVAASLLTATGSGGLDGGVNGLFLALFVRTRSGVLNLLHLFFSLGALLAPLVIGQLVDAGAPWRAIVGMSAVFALVIGGLLASQRMPSGIRAGHDPDQGVPSVSSDRRRSFVPFAALAAAIAFYVASEIGVSSWLVRYLADAPLSVATLALSLFWGGLTVGRLVSAAVADRFDAVTLAIASSIIAAIGLIAAVLSPSLPLAVALFAIGGFGLGPVYPLIMAIGGSLYPRRLAAVSGTLGASAVAGSIVYPPLMGFVSVGFGLGVGMLGTGLLGFATAGALLAATASRRRSAIGPASSERAS
jgi:fucose permease